MKNQEESYFYSSPIGLIEIQFKEDKLYSLSKVRKNALGVHRKSHSNKALRAIYPDKAPVLSVHQKSRNKKFLNGSRKTKAFSKKSKLVREKLILRLSDYFSGKKIIKWTVPLYPRGTDFQKKVWDFLRKIPYGKTCSYSDVAKAIGSAQAVRAVGSACGKNPWLILTPCHRVTAKQGLGGFALGLKAKTHLLTLENSAK